MHGCRVSSFPFLISGETVANFTDLPSAGKQREINSE